MKRILSFLLAAMMVATTLIAGTTVSAKLPFNDTDGHWGESAIEYVVENGLMNGVGNGESFAPNMSLTRGMVVTVLYRDNGSPEANFKGTFLDVAKDQYYTAAAEWAYEKKIVNGTGTDDWGVPYFSPDRDITRQELATMFKRYADFKHVDTAKGATDISSFPDASSVASWAADAVKWAVGVGLITGKSNGGAATLSPADKAVRAEFATIIKRFKEAKFEYLVAYERPMVMSTYTELPYAKVENADIYVSVDGSDTNPGTLDKPLATFEAAKVKVRELKKTAKDEIVVAFKAGDYGVLDNIHFGTEDSGTKDIPVTYCAYGDGDVYFTNGVYITKDQFKPLNTSDKEYFNSEFADKIFKVELADHPSASKIDSSVSISNADGLLWLARVPNKKNGVDDYFPGFTKHVILESSPYKTLSELIAANKAGQFQSNEEVSSHIDQNKIQASYICYDKLISYKTLEGAQLCGYIGKVWHQDFLDITGFDKETGILSTTDPTYNYYAMLETQQLAYINNVPMELDGDGEYWYKDDTKTFYIYNPKGDYFIATDGRFITGAYTSNLNFVNINFRCTKSEPVVFEYSDNITFDRTDISYVSGNGGFQAYRCLNFTLKNSEFGYFSGYGIYFRGVGIGERNDVYDYMKLENQNIVVENNYFHDIATVDIHSDVAAVKLSSHVIGAKIRHNEFSECTRHAISFGKSNGDVLIEYNVIHDCMTNSADGGAIHNGRGLIEPKNIIRYNIFYDIPATLQGGTMGIYLDDFEADNEIYGNIFYNVSQSILTNRGRDNSIHDNLMIESGTIHIGKDTNGLIETYNDPSTEFGNQYINILPKEGSPYYDIWREKCPIPYELNFDPSYTGKDSAFVPNNTVINNASFGAKFDFPEEVIAVSTLKDNIDYKITDNPLFECPAIGDYRIREDADFAKIPYEKIGRY